MVSAGSVAVDIVVAHGESAVCAFAFGPVGDCPDHSIEVHVHTSVSQEPRRQWHCSCCKG